MRLLVLFFPAFLFVQLRLHAQCPVVLPCPAQTDTICDLSGNDPLLWNAPVWFDPVHQASDLSDAPVDLHIRAIDTCGGGLNITCILWLDLDGNGTLETSVRSDTLQGPGVVRFNNLQIPGGEERLFDQRPVPDEEKYRFVLETASAGDTTIARLRWSTTAQPDVFTVPQLPAGLYRVRWIVETPMGMETWCTYTLLVRDCAPPVPVCLNGISGNLQPTKFLRIWDTDVLLYAEDNHTPAAQLQTAIRKSGTGTGFPLLPDGTPEHSIYFTCDELGAHTVELWARDRAGNAGFCETTVIVSDNSGYCGDPGSLQTCVTRYCDGKGIEDVTLQLSGSHPALPPLFSMTDNNGCASLQGIPFLGNYTLTPQKDDIPFTTAADIDRVRRHLDGSEPFTDPYQWVAADVNNNLVVDNDDVAEMEKMILGLSTAWPNNTAWRFVPKSYVFPAPNPLSTPVPASLSFDPGSGNLDFDFVGVRTGDLDLCAAVGAGTPPAVRRAGPAQPNPSAAGVIIPLQLGRAAEVRLDVFDVQGRRVYGRVLDLQPGQQQLEVPAEAFPASGVYGWRVTAEGIGVGGKVVRL